jgi:hypothetical protein
MASRVNYQFSISDSSEMGALHQRIGTAPPGIFVVIKAAIGAEYGCEGLNWIEHTGAYLNGAPYTPPGGWPWVGINVGGRDDGSPYSETDESHKSTIEGYARGWRGQVRDLYSPHGFDAVFLNWPASGGLPNWRHESIVVLVGRWGGVDHVAGALKFMFSTDEAGNLHEYGATLASEADLEVWRGGLSAGYPQYFINNL